MTKVRWVFFPDFEDDSDEQDVMKMADGHSSLILKMIMMNKL